MKFIEQQTDIPEYISNYLCSERYLPVPLHCVSPDALNGISIYIFTSPGYSLYNCTNNDFNSKDYHRLVEAGIKYVYLSNENHDKYLSIIQESMPDITNDKDILTEKKCEIIYYSTLALADQICTQEVNDKTITDCQPISDATIKMVMNSPETLHHLYNISQHDFYTSSHLANVSTFLIAFAIKVGVTDQETLRQFGVGGLIHDIGKLFVAADIINCKEPLDFDQTEAVKSHVRNGIDYIQRYTSVTDIALDVLAHHHERVDGLGYPHGLKNESISIAGKMAAVVDAFDAMTSSRPYRKRAMSIDTALENIIAMTPDHLDLTVVKAFANFIRINLLGENILEDTNSYKYITDLIEEQIKKPHNPSGRNFTRVYFRAQAKLRIMTKKFEKWELGADSSVILFNLSQGGMGVLSTNEYEENEIIHITVETPDKKPPLVYVTRVNRSKSYGNGWYTIGLEFLKTLEPSQVKMAYSILK